MSPCWGSGYRENFSFWLDIGSKTCVCIFSILSCRFWVITMFYETNRVLLCNKLESDGLVIAVIFILNNILLFVQINNEFVHFLVYFRFSSVVLWSQTIKLTSCPERIKFQIDFQCFIEPWFSETIYCFVISTVHY